jgi:hypothetical protein
MKLVITTIYTANNKFSETFTILTARKKAATLMNKFINEIVPELLKEIIFYLIPVATGNPTLWLVILLIGLIALWLFIQYSQIEQKSVIEKHYREKTL